VKIKFSRHANRRAKLYKVPESIIIDILTNTDLPDGEHKIIKEAAGFKYPLKIVFSVEDDIITIIITNYPLKKGKKNESLL